MNWSVEQYARFEQERNRPVRDLLAQVADTTVRRAADIGCGPGNSTEILQNRFPSAVITAIDNSDEMIQAGRKRLPNVQFEVASIKQWTNSGPFDVILASAALHWVPNHESLLPALIAKLAPGGSVAVQIPDNLSEPVHRTISQIASTGVWAERLAEAAQAGTNRHNPEWYYLVLQACANRVDIWRTTYYHFLAGGAVDITEWFKGTALRPYLDFLDVTEQVEFLHRFQESVADAYPPMANGGVLMPFPRLFFIATR